MKLYSSLVNFPTNVSWYQDSINHLKQYFIRGHHLNNCRPAVTIVWLWEAMFSS